MNALCFFYSTTISRNNCQITSSELIITNIVEEVLLNCSARELKIDPKDKRIKFTHAEFFCTAFI